MSFQTINFGYASAEREGADAPELLLKGYFDAAHTTAEALNGGRWLFLGYKGSGKSSVAERCRLLSVGDPMLFVHSMALSDFPYDRLRRDVVDGADTEEQTQATWAWLLLVSMLDSLRTDEAAVQEDPVFHQSIDQLKKLGYLPAGDLKALVLKSAEKGFKLHVPKIAEAMTHTRYEAADVALSSLVAHMRRLVCQFHSEAQHVIVIDGLDDALNRDDAYQKSLASLLMVTTRLNAEFRKWGAPAKVVVLCRSDIFDRLPGANKNKLRRDWAVTLDWYHDPRDPKASGLIKMADLRAGLAHGEPIDVLGRYFPSALKEGETTKLLLDHTRHTPRDFVELLKSIQRIAASQGADRQLTRDQILSGLRDYSISYFLPEIRDELDGYLSQSEIDGTIAAIAATRAREFTYADLKEGAASAGVADLDVERALRTLFDCSGVGTVQQRARNTRFTFKYRNRNSAVAMGDRFLLHRGVWKALNLV